MKIARFISVLCTVLLIIVLIYGLIMMIGDFMGVTTFNNQFLIIGIAIVLLSNLFQQSKPRVSIALLIIGIILIFIG
ncbi:hypothetical protein BU600_11720 [Staphylococcus arlettae]|uniref:Uncharacterized protein n=1 Tax=Staphylococcus arlettae TaxID=29378 RepID=A0A380CHS4_9STAP|nr:MULTISPECIES: hypothetical protein [Staphylococcus]EJY94813.1 hypothetical protein SARL_12371 [Staphylococcus arlettae CVD059]ERF49896.1 hypothetical protein N039_00415 [Staphylococcus sp. EGD-HP3]KAB2480013.1 hypothetical protein F9B39_03940 [Staphylococcus sp. CH99b_3]MBF0737506.1 hypothetical protein [Staphylococcus arlettae]MBK3718580.1 hypothetical protein [Staphylococcus arlettae]